MGVVGSGDFVQGLRRVGFRILGFKVTDVGFGGFWGLVVWWFAGFGGLVAWWFGGFGGFGFEVLGFVVW